MGSLLGEVTNYSFFHITALFASVYSFTGRPIQTIFPLQAILILQGISRYGNAGQQRHTDNVSNLQKTRKRLILESINRFLGTQTRARTGMDCSTGV